MNVTFRCPNCEATSWHEFTADRAPIVCSSCQAKVGEAPVFTAATRANAAASPANTAEGPQSNHGLGALRDLKSCAICGGNELFVRKDFPQKLGVGIVALGLLASCYTWHNYWVYWTFGILFATALADVALYLIVGDSLVCYRCRAEYRAASNLAEHAPFDLETHERFRRQKARLAEHRAAARGRS